MRKKRLVLYSIVAFSTIMIACHNYLSADDSTAFSSGLTAGMVQKYEGEIIE